MERTPEETTAWVGEIIEKKMEKVHETEVIGPNTLRIFRADYDPFVAGIVSTSVVTRNIVKPVLDADPEIAIIANVPKESIWTGSAIEFAASKRTAFGGLRDLMSAATEEDVRAYSRKEYDFVERGLIQHSRVSTLERKFDRIYLVHRIGLPPIRFVMLNEYELTAEHVRTAKSLYDEFDLVLINNPNGGPTATARSVADSMGVEILKWGEFLSRLNRE